MFETDAEIKGETREELPVVLEIKSAHYFLRRTRGEDGIVISDFTGERAVFTENAEGQIGDGTVVCGAGEGVAEGEEMAAGEFERTKMKGLRPLVEQGVAMLGSKKLPEFCSGNRVIAPGSRSSGKRRKSSSLAEKRDWTKPPFERIQRSETEVKKPRR